jgi:hypothetical protein
MQIGLTESQLVTIWRERPELFAQDVMGFTPTNHQIEGFKALSKLCIAKYKKSLKLYLTPEEESYAKKIGISVHSGHGTGKDAWLSIVIAWWLRCWDFSEGRITAPTSSQLEDNLWKEVRQWLRNGVDPIVKDGIGIQSDRIYRKDFKGEWFFSARTTNAKASADEQAETLAGAHKEFLMMGVDEASGVPDGVFKPLEGALTGRVNIAILIGNPTRSNGYFSRTHTTDREFWIPLRWDCEESNIDEITGSTGMRDYCERQAKKYGKDSNTYRVRVKGLLPQADPDTLIPYDWIMDAVDRDIKPLESSPEILGIDVAAGGSNKTVAILRHGPVVKRIYEKDERKSEYLADYIAGEFGGELCPNATAVDVVGVGWGFAGLLRDRGFKNLRPYGGGEKAQNQQRFRNKRDEDYWNLRERFENGLISIPQDDELIGQLSAIKYSPGPGNSVHVETKKEMKSRGIESPDKADALSICFSIKDSGYAKVSREDMVDLRAEHRRRAKAVQNDSCSWMAA